MIISSPIRFASRGRWMVLALQYLIDMERLYQNQKQIYIERDNVSLDLDVK